MTGTSIRLRITRGHWDVRRGDYKNPAAYRAAQTAMKRSFSEALAETYGLTDHPRRHAVFEKAWSDSHSEGLEGVRQTYEELAEIVQGPPVRAPVVREGPVSKPRKMTDLAKRRADMRMTDWDDEVSSEKGVKAPDLHDIGVAINVLETDQLTNAQNVSCRRVAAFLRQESNRRKIKKDLVERNAERPRHRRSRIMGS